MSFTAAAADYPTRPVHVIVGLTAGSGVDLMARIVGQKLAESMGQPFIIENKPGAGSNIGTRYAARPEPDGYTIFVATVANAINATLYKNLPFDVLKDFTPVILAATASNILIVNPSVPAKSVQELIALAKAKPGKLTVGSSGVGTAPQMTAVLFRHRAGINVVDVPFKGGPEATSALLGGQIDYLFAITSTALPHVKAGRLRALGVTSRAAHGSVARRADAERVRLAWLRGRDLVRLRGAERHAARHHRPAEQGNRQSRWRCPT